MTHILVVQKDTLESGKVKSVLTVCEEDPHTFVTKLQEGHCIPYQLIAFTTNNSEMAERLSLIVTPFKTNHGKNWYNFNHDTLAEIISLFVEYNSTWLDLQTISNIMGFSLKMYPVVKKEILISNIPSVPSKIHPKSDAPLKVEAVPLEKKDEIIEEILKIEKSRKGFTEKPHKESKDEHKTFHLSKSEIRDKKNRDDGKEKREKRVEKSDREHRRKKDRK